MSALPQPRSSRSRRPVEAAAAPQLSLVLDELIDATEAAQIIPLLAYLALLSQRERKHRQLIATIAWAMSARERLRKSPPMDVCYAAGGVIAALNSFGWLMDEWSWYRSEVRNWMIGNRYDDVVFKIGGQRIRATLEPAQMLVCACHALEASYCDRVMAEAIAGRPVPVRAIACDPHLTVAVLK
jgi:hypothetical protein